MAKLQCARKTRKLFLLIPTLVRVQARADNLPYYRLTRVRVQTLPQLTPHTDTRAHHWSLKISDSIAQTESSRDLILQLMEGGRERNGESGGLAWLVRLSIAVRGGRKGKGSCDQFWLAFFSFGSWV
ncbi:hypothetical protein HOY82DRAFT_558534, partial [Tuber indicum]